MSDAQASPDQAKPLYNPDFVPPKDRRWVLIAAVMASSMGFIDGTVVAIAIPAIRQGLGATLSDAQWIQNAYMLTLSALILTGGAVGDRFGLARIFAVGIGIFTIGSAISALAPTPQVLIWSRALQGVGAAIMVPGSLAIISRAYPRDIRPRAIGIWAAASALTTAAGPLVGGIVLTIFGSDAWRMIFAINLPLGALALYMMLSRVGLDAGEKGPAIDTPGALLATAALGLIAWAFTRTEGEGFTLVVMVIGAGGVAALAAFIAQEARAENPMMPLGLWADRTFSAANASTFLLYFGMTAILFYLPMTVIAGWGLSEIEAAIAFAPLSLFISVLSSRTGRIADAIGPGRLVAIGSSLTAMAYLLLAWGLEAQSFLWGVLPPMALAGIGIGLCIAPVSAAVMQAASDRRSGAASGVNNAISRIAGLMAVAAMGTLAASVYSAAGGTGSFGIGNGFDNVAAMNAGFRAICWTVAGMAGLSALIALLGIRAHR